MQAILDDINKIKSGKKELREFGFTIGGILLLLGAVAVWRGKASAAYLISFGAAFAILGAVLPPALKPLQKIWMSLAAIIGFFMSRLALSIIFYGVVTPIGILLKLSGKDILDEKIEKDKPSYWHDISKEVRTRESYENQF